MDMINLINKEAELSVLGTLLLDNEAQNKIDDININIFSDNFTKIVFKTMRKIIEEGKKLDIVILFEELKASNFEVSAESVTNLSVHGNIYTLKQNIDILEGLFIKRNLVEKADKFKNDILLGNNIDKALYDFEEGTKESKQQETYNDDISSIAERLLNTLESTENNGFKFGIDILDKAIGGVYKSELTTIGAKSGVGKTALALNIVQSALEQDKKVLIITREMTDEHILQRLITQKFGVSSKDMKNKNLDKNDGWEKVISAMSYYGSKQLHINHNISKPNEIRKRVAELKPDLVVVDYLQLLSSDKSSTSREQEVAYLSREMKKITTDFNTSVIQLTQLNDAYNGRPRGESAVRESKAIYHDSNNVIYIHMPMGDELLKLANGDENVAKMWGEMNLNAPMKLYEMIVAKSRDNGTAIEKMWYLGEHLAFKNFKDINI